MYQIKQKERNTLIFLSYLYKKNLISISESATELNMTYPTVKRITDELIEENLLLKSQSPVGNVGRSPAIFKINENLIFSIGILIEFNKIVFILSNIYGEIIKEKVLLNTFFSQENFKNIFLSEFDAFYLSLNKFYLDKIIGAGISFPGIVNSENLTIIKGINLNIENINLSELTEKYDFNFYIENEANASIYSAKILGEGKEYNDFILLSIGSGIGMGVYLESKLYRGLNGIAGEVGHTCFNPNGELCKCGNKGCWELYASETAILKIANSINPSEKYPISLDGIFKENNDIVKDYILYLSLGIRNLLFSFDITNIILGGEITQYLPPYKEKILSIIKDNVFLKDIDINIQFSKLHDHSSIIGAALIPISKYFTLIKD